MNDESCDNPNGMRVDQECDLKDGATNDDKIGKVVEFRTARDFAVVRQTSDTDVSEYSNSILDTRLNISGRLTEDGIQEAMSSGETIVRVGINTGRVEGTIDSMYHSDTYTDCGFYTDDDWIKYSNMDSGDGDSGGPYFVERYDNRVGEYLAVAGLHAQEHNGLPHGPSAYSIYQNEEWMFGKA